MRYLQEPPQAMVASELFRWLGATAIAESCAKWLLFDGAILGEKATAHLTNRFPAKTVHHIFANTELAAYGWAAPHLVKLPQGARGVNILQLMLEHTAEKPAFAVLEACADVNQLCGHLLWLARAKTDDGVRLYCRFADTRITPTLISVLCPHQRLVLQQFIEDWKIVSRNGALSSILTRAGIPAGEINGCNTAHQCLEEFLLSDEQFSTMMRCAEADETFNMLCEGAPDLVPASQMDAFHVRLSALAIAARQRGLESPSEIFQFTVIALTTSDSFFLNPVLEGVWRQVGRQRGAFASLVQSWSEHTWELLAAHCTDGLDCESVGATK